MQVEGANPELLVINAAQYTQESKRARSFLCMVEERFFVCIDRICGGWMIDLRLIL